MSGEKCLLRRPIVGEVVGPSDVDGKLPAGRCETEQPVLHKGGKRLNMLWFW